MHSKVPFSFAAYAIKLCTSWRMHAYILLLITVDQKKNNNQALTDAAGRPFFAPCIHSVSCNLVYLLHIAPLVVVNKALAYCRRMPIKNHIIRANVQFCISVAFTATTANSDYFRLCWPLFLWSIEWKKTFFGGPLCLWVVEYVIEMKLPVAFGSFQLRLSQSQAATWAHSTQPMERRFDGGICEIWRQNIQYTASHNYYSTGCQSNYHIPINEVTPNPQWPHSYSFVDATKSLELSHKW